MGKTQSTLEEKGYTVQTENNDIVTATKGGDEFIIKKIPQSTRSASVLELVETLKKIEHPHIVSYKDSFEDEYFFYAVNEKYKGVLHDTIRWNSTHSEEKHILNWFVQICMALKQIHEVNLIYKNLNPKSVCVTDYGTIIMDQFGVMTTPTLSLDGDIHYLSPETLTNGIYDAKSDIWRLGCVLYEMGERKLAFKGSSMTAIIPQILGDSYPSLGEKFSPPLQKLLSDIFQKDPHSRPSASEILSRPFIMNFIIKESIKTMKTLQVNLNMLTELADSLESMHKGTTIGSLAGGVIGAAGGITSIVGLILAPFTLGASLIVTGVGIGVAVAGGVTAGASNATNMYNQSMSRKAIKNLVKEFGGKTFSIVKSLQNITETLERLQVNNSNDSPDVGGGLKAVKVENICARFGRGIGGITELIRLIQVINVGKIAAQTARAVRVVEGLTGVLSGFFVAVDIFFIAMDAREIHRINQAQAAGTNSDVTSASNSESVTMKFIISIRKAIESLKLVHKELSETLRQFSEEILDENLDI